MKILHLAHGPFQGLPAHFMDMERRFGQKAEMVFFQGHAPSGGVEIPQILLDIYPIRFFRKWQVRHRVVDANRRLMSPTETDLQVPKTPITQLHPNLGQRWWRHLKNNRMRKKIPGIISKYQLSGYDVVHFDGARDLTHEADLAAALKREGAKIVSVFYGTELRVDGVTPALDRLSNLNLTMEFDHIFLHPNIHYLPAPFEAPATVEKTKLNSPLRIVHAPSMRYNKGTDLILPVIERLKSRYRFEFVLVEGLPQTECRIIKAGCDLCIDQIGNRGGTGYGVGSLEMLAQGIPCVSDFTERFRDFLPGNPFYVTDADGLEATLATILENPESLLERGRKSRAWVEATHGYRAVYTRLLEIYAKVGISPASTNLQDSLKP